MTTATQDNIQMALVAAGTFAMVGFYTLICFI